MVTAVLKEARTKINGGIMEDAPDWYDMPLEQLDFQWTPEEKLEIERYCEKIHKNISQEEMTPCQRLQALIEGKPKDRQFVHFLSSTVHNTRVYDGGSDIIKISDIERNPKLWVKAHLFPLARFGSDNVFLHPMSYTEEIWGGRARMIEMGQPIQVEPAIKTMADLENTEVPDPRSAGLFPGFLWAVREIRRIFDEYDLTGVVPLLGGMGPLLDGVVSLGMTGIGQFLILVRKNPELCQRATDLALEWNKRLAKEMHELCQPDWWQQCAFTGTFPLRANEWLADVYLDFVKFLKELAPERHLQFGYSSLPSYTEWMDFLQEKGAVGPDGFDGGFTGNEPWDKLIKMIDYHKEHGLYFTGSLPDEILSKGPISAIDDIVKELCEYSKSSPKYAVAILSDFWTPPEHWSVAMAAAKKYGKY